MTDPKFVNVEIPRDGYGRPMVMPVKGSKRVAYRRTTTFVAALEDLNGLLKWRERMVAYGMGQRKDLVLAAAATHSPDDKTKLNQIADQAREYALASASATTGTALHSLTERVDRGQPLGPIPAEYQGDIEAYEQTTRGIKWTGIESFRVHDDWKVAGTADRIGYYHDRLTIFDIKTGKIDFPHKMVMQLAMYARSTPYDIESDRRGTDPAPIDLGTGVIIHLPAGQGICNLYEIDIAKGWGACLLAKSVWDWRGIKDLTHLVGDDRTSTWQKSNTPTWTEMAWAAGTVEQLRELWRDCAAAGALTDDFRAAARKRAEQLGSGAA